LPYNDFTMKVNQGHIYYGDFMFYCEAIDKDGIPRAYGQDVTREKAETQCRWAALEKCSNGRFKIEDFRFVHDTEAA